MVRAVVKGGAEVRSELRKIDLKVDLATLAALKKMQSVAKKNIRSRLRGRPRWDRRGASGRTGAEVNLNLSPHMVRKGGGPGRLTGTLSRGVGGVKKPKPIPGGGFKGGVGVGIRVTNLYKRQLEEKYPYFYPAIKKTELEAGPIWEAAYSKAIHR